MATLCGGAQGDARDDSFDRPSLRPGVVPSAVTRGLEALDAGGDDDGPGSFPDEAAVRCGTLLAVAILRMLTPAPMLRPRRAKEARERARGVAGRAADFVPLDGAMPAKAPSAQRGGDLDGRESDQSGDEDDVRMCVPTHAHGSSRQSHCADSHVRYSAFVGTTQREPRTRPLPLDTIHAGDMDVERDDEEERFAQEQLRAGLLRGVPPAPRARAAAAETAAGHGHSAAAAMRAAATASAVALAAAREGCSRAQVALTATTAELARTRDSLSHCEAQILELEVSGAAAGERYKLVQEFRDYIRDLCECLKDKAPLVEELEDHLGRLEEAAAAAYAERADADADDENAPAQAAVAAASGALARGAGEAAARDAAAAAAAMASLAGGASLPPQLDELGRDLNAARRVNASRRASSRAARRAKHPPAPGTWTPGQSSESSDGERVSLASGRAAVVGEAGTVFADADDEFSTLERVKNRLEAFKRACGRAYRDAYVGESAAALFAPYVRLQLLTWSPVRPAGEREEDTAAGVALDEQPWFQELFDFGTPGGSDAVADDDMRLVPRLVAKVVIPRVRRAVDTAWRPDRRRQSRRLAAVLGELGPFGQDDADVATDLTMLHGAVALKLVHAAAAARVPAWAPPATAAAGELAHRCDAAAAARATRVVASIAAFDGVLPATVLVGPAVNTVLLRQMVPHLQSLAQHPLGWPAAARRIWRLAQTLPPTWSGVADAQQGMAALCSVAVALAGALARAASGPDRPDAATVRAVCETLALLNRGDDARALSAALT